MKLQHLAIGARFEYEGQVYVKTGPLTAASEVGGQRIIPRYAVLRPLDVPEAAPASGKKNTLDAAQVRTAFETFYACCESLPDAAQVDLQAARAQFFATLGLTP